MCQHFSLGFAGGDRVCAGDGSEEDDEVAAVHGGTLWGLPRYYAQDGWVGILVLWDLGRLFTGGRAKHSGVNLSGSAGISRRMLRPDDTCYLPVGTSPSLLPIPLWQRAQGSNLELLELKPSGLR
jgi:hypothetical protein